MNLGYTSFMFRFVLTGWLVWVLPALAQFRLGLMYAEGEALARDARMAVYWFRNPAVAGVDFVDEPVQLVISQGASSGRVSIQLLRNDDQQENRSLSATVSLVT